jgi:hypothetical protein
MRVLIVEDKVKMAGQLWRALRGGQAEAGNRPGGGADVWLSVAAGPS